MRASIVAVLSAVVASAQSAQNYSSELDMKIYPNKVEIGDRAVWCRAQTDTCNLLCDRNTKDNDCKTDTLEFKCTCAKNQSMPGLQFYQQTMPSFICQELYKECMAKNPNDADGQDACKKNIQDLCGTNPPPKAAISSDDNGGDGPELSSSASAPSSQRTSGPASSTSSGLAAPTLAPVGNGAMAAAAIGLVAYLV